MNHCSPQPRSGMTGAAVASNDGLRYRSGLPLGSEILWQRGIPTQQPGREARVAWFDSLDRIFQQTWICGGPLCDHQRTVHHGWDRKIDEFRLHREIDEFIATTSQFLLNIGEREDIPQLHSPGFSPGQGDSLDLINRLKFRKMVEPVLHMFCDFTPQNRGVLQKTWVLELFPKQYGERVVP